MLKNNEDLEPVTEFGESDSGDVMQESSLMDAFRGTSVGKFLATNLAIVAVTGGSFALNSQPVSADQGKQNVAATPHSLTNNKFAIFVMNKIAGDVGKDFQIPAKDLATADSGYTAKYFDLRKSVLGPGIHEGGIYGNCHSPWWPLDRALEDQGNQQKYVGCYQSDHGLPAKPGKYTATERTPTAYDYGTDQESLGAEIAKKYEFNSHGNADFISATQSKIEVKFLPEAIGASEPAKKQGIKELTISYTPKGIVKHALKYSQKR
jgi:hypothetical protein